MTSSSTRPPADLETKGAPTMLAPRPGPAAAKVGSAARSGMTEVDGGANRLARLVSIKGGPPPRLETKATTGVVAAQRRAGMPVASPCSMCERPAAAVVPGGLRAGESLICGRCVEVADDDTDTARISAGDLAELDELGDVELTSEEEYTQALGAEVEWDLLADGTLTRATDQARRDRAWGRP